MKPLNQWTLHDVLEIIRNVDKKTKTIIVATAIGVLLFLVFVVVPAWITRPILRREIQNMEAKIRQVNALNQKKLVWGENQVVFDDVIQKAKNRLFKPEEIGLLLGKVSRLADSAKVDVMASKPSNQVKQYQAPYNTLYQPNGYEFTLRGGYHELGHWVGLIESYDRLLRIESIQIQPAEGSLDKQTAEVKIDAISVSTLPPPPPPKAKVQNAKSKK